MSPHRRHRTTLRHRVTIGGSIVALLVGAGVVTRTVATADTAAPAAAAAAPCPPAPGDETPAAAAAQQEAAHEAAHAAGHAGHAAAASKGASAAPSPSPTCSPEPTQPSQPSRSAQPSPPAAQPAPPAAPALDILGNSCEGSKLGAHTGFQEGGRCVSIEFGEVGAADKNPSLLITRSPRAVRVNRAFDLVVSTRNHVRDRILRAGQGGYYKESSFLTADGLVRGHFHTACRMLATTSAAPDPAPIPAFFVATEDGKGNGQPDSVTVRVLGLPQTGLAQCAVWAGDGSHRVPMMERANQVPAFDVVRVRVVR